MTIETHTHGDMSATIDYDSSYESPREWQESTFVGFHRSYASPDKHQERDLCPVKEQILARSPENICLSVWLYIDSGTTYKASETNPFPCLCAGKFGYIYISRKTVRAQYGVNRITEETRQKVLADLAAQVDHYSQWANGELYRWEVLDEDGETVDSCGDYYNIEQARQDSLDCLHKFKVNGFVA